MKRMLLMIVGAWICAADVAAQSKVVVKLTNLRNEKGVCRVCLFDNATAFNGEGGTPVKCAIVPARGAATLVFDALPAGIYAVFVFHDANNNNRMDKNFLGIPKEGYGASRNSLPFAAAPGFQANCFTVPDKSSVVLQIRLRNL
jgi:uncharacterized protein (DUF2141 family)